MADIPQSDRSMDGPVLAQADSVTGAKQIQAKIMMELFAVDKPCGLRIITTWKACMDSNRRIRASPPTCFEEYVPLRGLDTGAP